LQKWSPQEFDRNGRWHCFECHDKAQCAIIPSLLFTQKNASAIPRAARNLSWVRVVAVNLFLSGEGVARSD
jgi:hypothetical protein